MTSDFDLPAIRKLLDALRARHGADSAIGHRCSNLIGLLKNYEAAAGDLKDALQALIVKQMAGLAKLSR